MDKFGVHLKHTELPNSREKERVRQTHTRRNQPANLKDLKNMFEGKSDGGTDSSSAPVSMGTDFKRSYTTQKTVTKTKTRAKTGQDLEDLAVLSQVKISIDANKNTTLEKTDSPKGARKFPKDDKLAEPLVVKSKVMASSSKTFKATVDSKVHRLNSEEKNPVQVDKKMAASSLIGNLALLQTRPGYGKKSDSSTVQSETSKSNGIFNEKSSFLKDKKTSSKESINSDKEISKLTSKTSETTDCGEKKLQELRASLKRTGSDKKGQFEKDKKGSAYTKKPETSVSPGPGLSRHSSSDSVASEKLSPRTSLRSKNRLKLDQSAGSDTGSSGSVSPRNKSFSPECKEEKPEWMEKSKELVNKFQTKLKKPESESTTSGSVSTNKSSTSASSASKSTLSTHKTETVTNTSSTFPKASVQRTDSGKKSTSLTKKEVLVTRDASSSKEFLEKFAKDKDSKEQRAEKLVLSRKESSELFQKLKGGYEQSDDASKSAQPKPKIEVPNSNKFVERRNSFEKPKPADTTKCKTLRNLQDDGKIVGVKDRISALNQGKGEVVDERFKKQIQTQKSVESVRSSDQEYHDVAVNPAPANDWPSDSDSSADNMYEYIPATGEYLALAMSLSVMVAGPIISV